MERYGDNCTMIWSKFAQQNCQNLHNKLLKKCTIHIAKLKKICYSKKEGESIEVNYKRLYEEINR